MNRCLYCYKELKEGIIGFHPHCAKKIFGSTKIPALPYLRDEMKEQYKAIIHDRIERIDE